MRCGWCNKKTHIPLACKACLSNFCVACIRLEAHECPELASFRKSQRELLAKKLVEERTVDVKVSKI